jgi:hypothetical protein
MLHACCIPAGAVIYNRLVINGDKVNVESKQIRLNLSDLDQRTSAAKSAKALIADLESDLGGAESLSAAQRVLIERAAVAVAMLRHLETQWLAGGGCDVGAYTALTATLQRCLQTLGTKRQSRDISLEAYLAGKTAKPPSEPGKAAKAGPEYEAAVARAAHARAAKAARKAEAVG